MKKPIIVLDTKPPELPFEGFGEGAFKFLHGLKNNNKKEWFEKNRPSYEDDLREPSKRLVSAMKIAFAESKLPLIADQRRSLFRVNRDIRFSKDKSPYKTHIGIVFPMQGMKADEWSGMYLGFEPAGKNDMKVYVGGGAYMPSAPFLKKIRKKLDTEYKQFQKLVSESSFKKNYPKGITGESLKRPPRGYSEDHPALELLKLKSFTFSSDLTKKDLMSPKLPKILMEKIVAALGVLSFLAD
ncbi:MAG: DUF2461 domain-containing protein [Ignavibacteriota bacterium]